MPARIERRVSAMNVAAAGGQIAAGGWTPLELGVPSNKKWNLNLIFQSTDGGATRNAKVGIAGGKPAHGLNALAIGPALAGPYAVSPTGTYFACIVGGAAQIELYKRVGATGLVFLGMMIDAGGGVSNMAFSPDERYLAWTSVGFTNVFATAVSDAGFGATSNSAAMAALAFTPGALTWSPTGAYLAVATVVAAAAGRLSVYPFAAGVFGGRIDAPTITAADNLWGGGPAWAPDESAIAAIFGIAATGQLYGWPWAAGAFGTMNKIAGWGGMAAGGAGRIAWCPDASTKILAFGPPTIAGANAAHTSVWNGAAWAAVNNLTAPAAVPGGKAAIWLNSRMVLHYLFTAATAGTAIIDLINPITGAVVVNVQNLAAGIFAGPGAVGTQQMFNVDGQLFRLGGAGIVLETFLQPALTLFPVIGILANARAQLSGITLEAGDRLLVGTPAATDIFALSGSAIEIG